MAVAVTNLTIGNDVDGNSTATTASVTLPANELTLATITSRTGSGDPNHPTILGWTEVLSVNYDNSGSQKRHTVLRRLSGSGSTGTLTIDFAAQNQTDIAWVIDSLSGVDTGGTNGATAVVQAVSNVSLTGSATTLTATLAAFGSTSNATYGSIGVGNKSLTVTAGTGFTKTGDAEAALNGVHATGEFKTTNDTTVDFTSSLAGELAVIGIEIKAAVVSGTNIQINIGDTWKTVSGAKINIGDSWKDVVSIKQNIGDVWKTVF